MPFIIKPAHNCQGRGIYLINKIDDYISTDQQTLDGTQKGASQVAQAYLDNPLLINGLKFDLRLYVLISGIHPLRLYLYEEGMARFATVPYQKAKEGGDL